MKRRAENTTKPTRAPKGVATVPRLCRWPVDTDRWLEQKARAGGFRSVQEYVNHLIGEVKQAEAA